MSDKPLHLKHRYSSWHKELLGLQLSHCFPRQLLEPGHSARGNQRPTSGPITFYYGEEIGDQLDGFAAQNTSCGTGTVWCDDNVARTTGKVEGVTSGFTPSARQSDLKTYLKSLLDMRAAHPALSTGSLTRIFTDSQVFVSRKDTSSDNVLYLLNAKSTPAVVTLSTAALGDSGELVNLLDSSNTVTAADGNYVITVPAFSGVFYQINTAG